MLCPFENFLVNPLVINEESKVHAVVDIGLSVNWLSNAGLSP
jgi:hypothetical protein